jgi:hypothetical protein
MPAGAKSDDASVGSTNVELATLTIASSFLHHHNHQIHHGENESENYEATLHLHGASAAETSAALIAENAEAGASAPSAAAIVVVDLTVLSDLARAREDEFVIGLHREAHDQHFNPRDSFEESESSSSDESAMAETMEDDTYFRGGERQPLVRKVATSSIPKEKTSGAQVTMNANAFADALENAIPIPETSTPIDEFDNITVLEDRGEGGGQVELFHEAFLLELPGNL